MSEHTKGQLRIAADIGPCVVVAGDRGIAECYDDGEPQTLEDAANARRLVACWNACLGISTETLEAKDLTCCDVAAHQVNAELIAALRESKDMLRHTRCKDDDATRCPACSMESRIDTILAKHAPKVKA